MPGSTRKATLTSGDPGSQVLRMALPMLAGILGMVAFNLADTYFVGRLGTIPLAAMSFTFPLVFVVNSIALGLGVGTSTLVSRAIGSGDDGEVRRIVTSALMFAFFLVVILVSLLRPLLEPIFISLGADQQTLPYILDYMKIWLFGMPFVVFPMLGNNALRATGDTRTPALIMIIGATMNVIIDPLLIFGLGPFPVMGIKGAALATVIGRATTLSISMTIISRRERMIGFHGLRPAVILGIWKRLIFVGLPAMATNMIMPVSVGIITRLISVYGPAAVAGFGVASRIETFVLAFMRALASVIVPFVGQNSAAREYGRSVQGLRAASVYSMLWSLLWVAAVILGRHQIAGIFSDNPEVVEVTSLYLLIVTASYGFHGVLLIVSSGFNGLNRPLRSAMVSLTRMFLLYIPLALFLRYLFGVAGIFGAAFLANVAGGIFSYLWIMHSIHEEEKRYIQSQ
ncbi:MATE family efflux transporter [Marispirochaeta aestuarii]|uniref:MATE family efflux transporter n=1 Tax=Marispirochaeta aestuarii TaxID=1963862 RepID=UPI0029C6127B|nr:MATE family efflux transporter [Marispirochaeta aestuarii]